MSTPRETFFDVNEYENRLKQVKKQLVINSVIIVSNKIRLFIS